MSKELRTRVIIIVGVFLASLFFAFPLQERINLGLDLKGGMHLILKVETEKLDENAKKDAVQRAIEILRNRIDGIGIGEPVIQQQGRDQILVQLPGITDYDAAMRMIGKVAQLEFIIGTTDSALIEKARAGDVPEGFVLKEIKEKKKKKGTPNGEDKNAEEGRWILLNPQISLKGDTISDALVDYDYSTGFGEPKIILTFNSKGAKQFSEITRQHIEEPLAIVLDGEVLSAPNIKSHIANGRGEITGRFTTEEASLLALSLRSGSLPAPMRVEEDRTVGPLLGRDSINAGVKATIIGGILVISFMLLYYLFAGIVSNIALMYNLLLILGIMGFVNFMLPDSQLTLTLPGIAGIILTLGMAVDANVLINERIREEINNGRPLHASITNGFSKAFKAIFDSNFTTLIAAFMLFQFGSGPIKGFAVTLSIGLLASLFTSLFVTRTLFLLLVHLKLVKSLPMLKLFNNTKINFVSKRYFCFALSTVIILIGMYNFFQKKDQAFGIDFAGGQVQVYQFEKPVESAELRDLFNANGIEDVVIQTSQDKTNLEERHVIIRSPEDTYAEVVAVFKKHLPDNPFEIRQIEKVGPLVGAALKRSAILAMIFALGGILTYVGFRFHHFDFATAGVIALLHDVIITLGILVLFGRQIDLLVVTALLTIAGYSINDTIIIYDRVRENTAKSKKTPLADILNLSINQTLGRTILTTITTLLVVVSLYLWGGEILNTFALCLLIGFVAGTYSTIFIASPLVLAWQKKR